MKIFARLNKSGFTLIELMIVMSIIGILAAIAAPNYRWGLIKARESVLSEHLYVLRSTIDQFYADQGKFPDSLQELVEKRYLPKIPKDPFTGKEEWGTKPPPVMPTEGDVKGGVGDVYSMSDLKDLSGKPYGDW